MDSFFVIMHASGLTWKCSYHYEGARIGILSSIYKKTSPSIRRQCSFLEMYLLYTMCDLQPNLRSEQVIAKGLLRLAICHMQP